MSGNQLADWPMTSFRSHAPDIMPVENLGFDLMTNALSGDSWLLEPKTMEMALEGLTSYDMILLDLPAFAMGADNLAVAAALDGVVLVAESGVTPIAALKELVRTMHAYHAPMIGVVLAGSAAEPRRFLHSPKPRLGRMLSKPTKPVKPAPANTSDKARPVGAGKTAKLNS